MFPSFPLRYVKALRVVRFSEQTEKRRRIVCTLTKFKLILHRYVGFKDKQKNSGWC